MSEVNFNTLSVVLAHVVNSGLINTNLIVILESSQEVSELSADELIDLFASNPLRNRTRSVRVVINISQIVRIVSFRTSIVVTIFFTVHHLHSLGAMVHTTHL